MCRMRVNVLAVGLGDKSEALHDLPVQLFVVNNCAEAIRCLKDKRLDAVISQWDLVDVSQGQFLSRVTSAKPGFPAIAIVKGGDVRQEMAARSLGVIAVLEDDIDDDYFRDTVCHVLGIDSIAGVLLAKGSNNSNEISYSAL